MRNILYQWLQARGVHILAWASLIIYESVLAGVAFGVFGHPVTYIVHYAINIVYFYAVSDIALPWATRSKKFTALKVCVFVLVYFAIYMGAVYLLDNRLIKYGFVTHVNSFNLDLPTILKSAYRYIYFTAFAVAYFLLRKYLQEKKRAANLETARLTDIIEQEQVLRSLESAQNNFLRAQINPHFLFNTLNFIYFSVHDSPDESAEAILVLSDIMRYAVEGQYNGDRTVLVEDELKQVEKLLYLYGLRHSGNSNIKLLVNDDALQLLILPLILLTMIENIFKHANLGRNTDPAIMEITIENGYFKVSTRNLINNSTRRKGTNTGMSNIETRLKNAYGLNAIFGYGIYNKDRFQVSLAVPVNLLQRLTLSEEAKQL